MPATEPEHKPDAAPEPQGSAGGASPLLWSAIGTLGVVLLMVLAAVIIRVEHSTPRGGSQLSGSLVRPPFDAAPRSELRLLQSGSLIYPLAQRLRSAESHGRIDVARLRGSAVVINFWASWCDPCQEEAPLLEREWLASRSRGVLFLGVDQSDAADEARAFLKRFRVSYPILREDGESTSLTWGVRGYPVTFFLAADGHVVGELIGQLQARSFEQALAAARRDTPTS